jgi:hypothetical protein
VYTRVRSTTKNIKYTHPPCKVTHRSSNPVDNIMHGVSDREGCVRARVRVIDTHDTLTHTELMRCRRPCGVE